MASDKKAEKAAEKEAKRAKREATKQRWKQVWAAFQMQRKQDSKLLPLMLLALVGVTLLFWLFGVYVWGGWTLAIAGFMFGILAALWIFTRRLQNTVYSRAEGQAGAAGWALENLKSGVGIVWKVRPAVEANPHMDAVHRVVGNCGIVLVGEGDPNRVKSMMRRQRQHLGKIAPSVPIYEMFAGEGEGQIPIRKLQRELMKLPREMKKDQAYALAAKVDSFEATLGSGRMQGIPKGPLPKGGNMSGMNRRARRTQARNKRG
ncbi:DUF4191 domain-containing protein [Corynebacterium choanae]|uniref:DUF4191 domain-containing protein n=1 Tax=Corynebacterium choanae TaxID=1862358 RepID=A0A3G6JCW4_9CORY|nr:DUF4191 domain-containing protein [Corynebacterium choanae]AZA13994.1 hypothetical protein CCHOA_08010 [Corynebacterium choanae]